MRNFNGTLLVTSITAACVFVLAAVFVTGHNETMNRIVEDSYHFLMHYLPAMLAGYGFGKAGEVGMKKLRKREKRNA